MIEWAGGLWDAYGNAVLGAALATVLLTWVYVSWASRVLVWLKRKPWQGWKAKTADEEGEPWAVGFGRAREHVVGIWRLSRVSSEVFGWSYVELVNRMRARFGERGIAAWFGWLRAVDAVLRASGGEVIPKAADTEDQARMRSVVTYALAVVVALEWLYERGDELNLELVFDITGEKGWLWLAGESLVVVDLTHAVHGRVLSSELLSLVRGVRAARPVGLEEAKRLREEERAAEKEAAEAVVKAKAAAVEEVDGGEGAVEAADGPKKESGGRRQRSGSGKARSPRRRKGRNVSWNWGAGRRAADRVPRPVGKGAVSGVKERGAVAWMGARIGAVKARLKRGSGVVDEVVARVVGRPRPVTEDGAVAQPARAGAPASVEQAGGVQGEEVAGRYAMPATMEGPGAGEVPGTKAGSDAPQRDTKTADDMEARLEKRRAARQAARRRKRQREKAAEETEKRTEEQREVFAKWAAVLEDVEGNAKREVGVQRVGASGEAGSIKARGVRPPTTAVFDPSVFHGHESWRRELGEVGVRSKRWDYVNWVLWGMKEGLFGVNQAGGWLWNVQGSPFLVLPWAVKAYASDMGLRWQRVVQQLERGGMLMKHKGRSGRSMDNFVWSVVVRPGLTLGGLRLRRRYLWQEDDPPMACGAVFEKWGNGRWATVEKLAKGPSEPVGGLGNVLTPEEVRVYADAVASMPKAK